jgi:hypothetical protein
MSADRDVTRIVRSWLQTDDHESADRVLHDVLARLDTTSQRRPLRQAWMETLMSNSTKFAAAGTAVLVVAAVALAIYFSRPTLSPAASPSASASAPNSTSGLTSTPSPTLTGRPSPVPSTQPTPTEPAVGAQAPWLFFWLYDDDPPYEASWVMRADGSDAQQIDVAGGFPDALDWSDDGTQLVVLMGGAVYVAEVGDDIGELVDTGFRTLEATACLEKAQEPFPCQDSGLSVSHTGDKIAFVQRCTYEDRCAFLTLIDMVTGERTELSATLDDRPRHRLARPTWSPDDSQLAFDRVSSRTDDGDATSIYVINADGTGLSEIELGGLDATDARWSPDGTRIAFTDLNLDGGLVLPSDIWTVHLDGSELMKVASGADSPDWLSPSEIRFRDVSVDVESNVFHVVDGNQEVAPYIDLAPAIDAIRGGAWPIGGVWSRRFTWQPAGDWRPTL